MKLGQVQHLLNLLHQEEKQWSKVQYPPKITKGIYIKEDERNLVKQETNANNRMLKTAV